MTNFKFPWNVRYWTGCGYTILDADGTVLFTISRDDRSKEEQREIAEYIARTCNAAHDSASLAGVS